MSAGGQPTGEQLNKLKDEGTQVIINLSPTSTKNYLAEEAQIVEKSNMDYVHFPVDCSNLKPEHYKTVSNLLKLNSDKKVFIHCGGNIKTSNLIYMYKILEENVSKNEAMSELTNIQQPEQKWFKYFEQMGVE